MSYLKVCENHVPIQHRDGKPPWCRKCGLTRNGEIPHSLFSKTIDRIIEAAEMDQLDMQDRAKLLVAQYYNSKVEKTDGIMLVTDDVYVVWFVKTLQNWKCLISTTVSDGMYYEVTHNGDKRETYLDAYKKWENVCIPDGEQLHTFVIEGR